MKLRIKQAASAAAFALSWWALSAQAAPLYSVTPLGVDTYAGRGINATGLVTGSAQGGGGFIANGNNITPLTGEGYAINASGQVTGAANDGSHVRAFLYNGTTSQNLGTLPGDDTSWGYGINASGQVVGFSGANGVSSHAFLYDQGTMKDLGALGGADITNGSGAVAYGINDQGQITGTAATATNQAHAFFYSNGTMTDIGTLAGDGGLSDGYAINANGHITGTSFVNDANGQYLSSHAFLYDGTTMRDLDELGGALSYSAGAGINRFDDVVGLFQNIDPVTGNVSSSRGFLYSHETHTFHDLNDLVTGLDGSWVISAGYAINDLGSIAAMETDANGLTRAVLLTVAQPVPEPGTCALSLMGLIGIAGAARRRQTGTTRVSSNVTKLPHFAAG
jgi:probable HAF family extracellular repeat protein